MILACAGVLVQAIAKIMFCIRTDLPLPVDPAMSVCGAFDLGERNRKLLSSSRTAMRRLSFPTVQSGRQLFHTLPGEGYAGFASQSPLQQHRVRLEPK